MESHAIRPYILTIGLLLLAGGLLAVLPPVRETDQAGIRDTLPDQVGRYTGTDLRYCQNEHCLRIFTLPELAGASLCPACGGTLGEVSMVERLGLPVGTTIVRRRYAESADSSFLVTIVLAGHDRNSFHRPQLCLPAQGFVIDGRRVVPVPRTGRNPLRVEVLDIRRPADHAGARASLARMAYWFASPTRETPSNLGRLFWMMADRIVHGRADRWAYVAVTTSADTPHEAQPERLQRFIADLYPLLVRQ